MAQGFASDIPPAVNGTAKKYIRGMMKGKNRWNKLYGNRSKEVMHKTANKMAMGEMSKMPPTYTDVFGEANKMKKEEFVNEKAGEKDACYKKVKASAKVWPSAYASGRLVQCRKKGAANYGNKSEGMTFQQVQEKCWKGYKKVGMKKKGDKLVPNCVPEGVTNEGAAWTKKSGKNSEGGLNEKGRKSYERENPGSDLKAPSKKVGNPRRASFCARMKGMRKRQKPSNNTGDDRLSKSLRAWNC
ncbi:hypothetical protein W1240910_099 [Cyanophage S-RIM12_W1_24_0910]|uniref:DUF6321 domain-containing protein n=1 Tax=Cyanophage S-RIM12 TaxID=1278402 RepID=A0A1D7SZU6_9CAUD|nr:hypothetical protein W1240910_099 [Cyanophage S-RIM12_W1_24_0910]